MYSSQRVKQTQNGNLRVRIAPYFARASISRMCVTKLPRCNLGAIKILDPVRCYTPGWKLATMHYQMSNQGLYMQVGAGLIIQHHYEVLAWLRTRLSWLPRGRSSIVARACRRFGYLPTYQACKIGTPNACNAGSVKGPVSASMSLLLANERTTTPRKIKVDHTGYASKIPD